MRGSCVDWEERDAVIIDDYQDELCRRVAYELQLQLDTCKAKKDTLTDKEIKKLF